MAYFAGLDVSVKGTAVTAYLLYLNGIIGERDAIDAESLPRVKMPNQNNFKSFYLKKTP